MRTWAHAFCVILCAGIALNACDAPTKKKFDLYELAPVSGNDNYYSPPKNYCTYSIATSLCGGI